MEQQNITNTPTKKKVWWQYIVFFYNWKIFEKCLLGIVVLLDLIFYILAVVKIKAFMTIDSTITTKNNIRILLETLTLAAGITNIICLIYTSRKAIIAYIYAIVSVILLGGVGFFSKNAGNWILNWAFALPLNCVGFFIWRKHSEDKQVIKPRELSWLWRGILLAVIVVATVGLYFLFSYQGFREIWYGKTNWKKNNEWYKVSADALSLVISVVAIILTMLRYRDIWYLWIVCDALFVILYATEKNWPMAVTWTGGLINAIYGLINWRTKQKVLTTP